MELRSFPALIKNGVTQWFFPFICILCSEKTKRSIDLCIDCEKNLPWLKHVCIHCAMPLGCETNFICGACLNEPLPFYKVCILFSYTEAIRKWIIGLKFQQRLLYANILGSLLAERIKLSYQNDHLPDLIIPVPLHKKRL